MTKVFIPKHSSLNVMFSHILSVSFLDECKVGPSSSMPSREDSCSIELESHASASYYSLLNSTQKREKLYSITKRVRVGKIIKRMMAYWLADSQGSSW